MTMRYQVLKIKYICGDVITSKSDPVDTFEEAESMQSQMMKAVNQASEDSEMFITVKR